MIDQERKKITPVSCKVRIGSDIVRRRTSVGLTLLLAGLSIGLTGCFLLNIPPVADFTRSPSFGELPLSVFFNAEASHDPDGTITAYEWSFGDGEAGSGKTATHTYEAAGTYSAKLIVTDDRGARDSAIRMIVVEEPGEEIPVGTQVGQRAPAFTLEDLEDEKVSLSDFLGNVVILDFWASWCSPCRYSLPHLENLGESYRDQGVVVLGVNLDESRQDAESYLEQSGYSNIITLWESYPAAQAVKHLYAVAGIPHTFLIDRQGIIRYSDHPIRLRDYHIEPWL